MNDAARWLAEVNAVYPMLDEGRAEEAHARLRLLLDGGAGRDASVRSAALIAMGYAACALERFEEAREACRTLLAEAEGDMRHIALHQLGMVERLAGELPRALALFEQELALLSPEDAAALSANGYERALLRLKLGCVAEAETLAAQALDEAQRSGDAVCIGCAWRLMGEIAARQNRPDAAAQAWRESMQAFLRAGDPVGAQEVQRLLDGLEDS